MLLTRGFGLGRVEAFVRVLKIMMVVIELEDWIAGGEGVRMCSYAGIWVCWPWVERGDDSGVLVLSVLLVSAWSSIPLRVCCI